MKKLIQNITSIGLLVGVVGLAVPAMTVSAIDLDPCTVNPDSTMCANQGQDEEEVIMSIINVLLFIVGAVAVIMLIWGGIRYTTSGGNQNAVASGKNTIMYAVIGLAVAIFAYAIVNFVVDWMT